MPIARPHRDSRCRCRTGARTPQCPVTISGEVVGVVYADEGAITAEIASANHAASWMTVVEILARHAARCLEAIIALKATRALTGQSDPTSPAHEETADEQAAASRYAKLLVSEIRLYHEADVTAGRRERDLATRLGGEIARARVLYEQRVPPHVPGRSDYFHDELVRTLADGDASLLAVQT